MSNLTLFTDRERYIQEFSSVQETLNNHEGRIISLECGCNDQGSANMTCNSDGICTCKENVTGEKCDICIPEHFPFPECNIGNIYIPLCIVSAI